MKVLAIFYTSLAAVTATSTYYYPEVTSWGMPEIENWIANPKHKFSDSRTHCLYQAYNAFVSGLMDGFDETKSLLKERDTLAVIPTPAGQETWSKDELMATASVIIQDLSNRRKGRRKGKVKLDDVNIEGVEKAINKLTSVNGEPKSSEELINLQILRRLLSILTDSKVLEDGHKLNMLVIDTSMWTADEIRHTVKKLPHNSRLALFLEDALYGRYADHNNLANGKKCVVTPVNVIPSIELYYYLPPKTKSLLKRAKKIYEKMKN